MRVPPVYPAALQITALSLVMSACNTSGTTSPTPTPSPACSPVPMVSPYLVFPALNILEPTPITAVVIGNYFSSRAPD